mgnify:CR=1 FL=1
MQTALVTGGEQGLGWGFVEYLLSKGWQVYATTRRMSEQLPQKPQLSWVPLELGSDASIRQVVERLSSEIGQLDLLVNNAGVNKDTATNGQKERAATLGHLDRDTLLMMYDINAVAPILLTQALVPLLTGSPSFVINISSCRASFADEFGNDFGNYGYRASKAALTMLTHCLTWDLPPHIQTYSVHPGSVRSTMNPTGTDEPVEAAKAIVAIRETWQPEHNGQFFRYSGELYPR